MFCTNCGNAILDDANFCPKCGVRTVKGVNQKVPLPKEGNWEERLEATVETIGEEMEKAFSTARRELEKAYSRTKESMRRPSDAVICPNCDEKNQSETKYCYKCGTKLNS